MITIVLLFLFPTFRSLLAQGIPGGLAFIARHPTGRRRIGTVGGQGTGELRGGVG